MADLMVNIGGDASGALAAVAAAEAALAGLSGGRTCVIDIKVRGLEQARRDIDGLRGDLDRLNASARSTGDQLGRVEADARSAGMSVSGLGRRADTTNTQVGGLGDSARAARASVSGMGGGAERATGQVGELGNRQRYTAEQAQGMSRNFVGAGLATAQFTRSATGLLDVGGRTAETVGGLARAGSSAASGVGGLARAGSGLGSALGPAGAAAGTLVSGLAGLTVVGGVAAVGAGLVTTAVGALGAASAVAFGGFGGLVGAAGAGLTGFAVDALSSSAKFSGAFKQIGQEATLWSQYATEPYGDALVSLAKTASGAGMAIAGPMRGGFAEMGRILEGAAPALVGTAAGLAQSFEALTKQAGPGVEAFLGNLPRLAGSASGAMQQMATQFGQSAGAALEEGVPAFGRLANSVGGLGAQLIRMGGQNLAPTLDGLSSMTDAATSMSRDLQPAVQPAMQAFTDMANAGMGALGALSPDIAGFAETVSANKGGIQSGLESIGGAMMSVGGSFVEGFSMAAPAMQRMDQTLQSNAPATADLFGKAVSAGAGLVEFGSNLAAESSKFLDSGMFTGGGGSAGALVAVARAAMGAASDGGRGVGVFAGRGASFDPAGPAAGPVNPSNLGVFAGRGGPMSMPAAAAASISTGPTSPLPAVFNTAPQTNNLGAALKSIAQDANNAGGALSALAPVASQSMGQIGSAANQVARGGGGSSPLGSFMQAMNRDTQAIQSTATPAAASAFQSFQQVAGNKLAATSPAVGQAAQQMTRQVQNSAPAAADAGASIGAAVTSGAGGGITKTETKTLTIVRKWITKIIDAGMSALGASSPSREFIKIGGYIVDGMSVGVTSKQQSAVTSVQRMMGQSINAATGTQAAASKVGAQIGGSMASGVQQAMTGPDMLPRQNPLQANLAIMQARQDATMQAMQRQRPQTAPTGMGELAPMARNMETLRAAAARTGDAVARVKAPRRPGEYDGFTASWVGDEQGNVRSSLSPEQEAAAGGVQRGLDAAGDGLPRATRRRMEQLQRDIRDGKPRAIDMGQQIGMEQLQRDIRDGKPRAVKSGREIGAAIPEGIDQGVAEGGGRAGAMMSRLSQDMIDESKRMLGINSPSTVFAGIGSDVTTGLGQGMGSALGAASAGIRGVASDRGLQVGYSWARSVVTGADVVLKRDLFQAVAAPKIESPQAKAALGRMGMLGPAGSGASVWKNPMVTLGGASAPTVVHNHSHFRIDLDGQPFREMAVTQIDQAMGDLANQITLQAG